MKVQTIRRTSRPERLVCQAARGDYYDGFVGEATFEELMEGVQAKERHYDAVDEALDGHHDRKTSDPRYNTTMVPDGHGVSYEHEYVGVPNTLAKQYALLERLFRQGHWGPFEHPQITIGVKGVSRSCMAQITRHRHATFDVQSQRYVDFSEKDDPVKTPKSLVDPDHATRGEGSVDVDDRETWQNGFEAISEDLVDQYEWMVEAGVPKEDARFILPIGTTVNVTMSVNARMLLHIEDMRKTGGSQWEIREMTEKIHDEFADWMPMTAHLYEEHGPHKIAP